MKVAMIKVSRLNRQTTAMQPFYVSEKYARMHEIAKTARRATPEEIKQFDKSNGNVDLTKPADDKELQKASDDLFDSGEASVGGRRRRN
jgi:hypothetical protein